MAIFQFHRTRPHPGVSELDWSSWTWQMSHSLKSRQDFEKHFRLSSGEAQFWHSEKQNSFNNRCTPYYASLVGDHPEDPLRKIFLPQDLEFSYRFQEMEDPLAEKHNSPSSRLIHRYSDRVLLLVTDVCSLYCRFCTRKHFTGKEQAFLSLEELQQALSYIKTHRGIREVILSGGDPLTLSNARLFSIMSEIRAIDHVEIIRIGSRMPVVNPFRIDRELAEGLRKYKPVFVMTHFNHPRELTFESAQALELLVDHGVPVFNQMVLLNGVNNHPAIVQALSRRLLYLRVKPYYMFQCDPSLGTDHLRTSVEESLALQKELWGHLSGLAMPTLALDIPNGGGKTVLVPDFQLKQEGLTRTYRGWDGVEAKYISPSPEHSLSPTDAHLYLEEWNQLKGSKNFL